MEELERKKLKLNEEIRLLEEALKKLQNQSNVITMKMKHPYYLILYEFIGSHDIVDICRSYLLHKWCSHHGLHLEERCFECFGSTYWYLLHDTVIHVYDHTEHDIPSITKIDAQDEDAEVLDLWKLVDRCSKDHKSMVDHSIQYKISAGNCLRYNGGRLDSEKFSICFYSYMD